MVLLSREGFHLKQARVRPGLCRASTAFQSCLWNLTCAPGSGVQSAGPGKQRREDCPAAAPEASVCCQQPQGGSGQVLGCTALFWETLSCCVGRRNEHNVSCSCSPRIICEGPAAAVSEKEGRGGKSCSSLWVYALERRLVLLFLSLPIECLYLGAFQQQ